MESQQKTKIKIRFSDFSFLILTLSIKGILLPIGRYWLLDTPVDGPPESENIENIEISEYTNKA